MKRLLNLWFHFKTRPWIMAHLVWCRLNHPPFRKFLTCWFGAWALLTGFAVLEIHPTSVWRFTPLETIVFLLIHCFLVVIVLSLKEGAKPCTVEELEWCKKAKDKATQTALSKQAHLEQALLSKSLPEFPSRPSQKQRL